MCHSSAEEGKTVVISSGLALMIFLMYFVLLRVCTFEACGNKFGSVFNAICVWV